jgi:Gpi18-like mannosyltransferase
MSKGSQWLPLLIIYIPFPTNLFTLRCMDNRLTRNRIELLVLFALYVVILPKAYMAIDKDLFLDWTLYIHHHGLQNVYGNATIDYPPVFTYIMYIFGLLQGTDTNIVHNFEYIKLFTLFFDFLPIVVLCAFRQKILSFKIPYLFLLLNVAYLFNCMVWGQIDGIYTNLVFLALLTGIFYPVPAILLYVLALNAKVQAIQFLPVMVLILFYSIRRFSTLLSGILAAIALQVVILLPFIISGQLGKMIHVFTHVVNRYNNLSINAYNIWYLITRGNPFFVNSNDVYFIFSYKTIGLIFFGLSLMAIGIPFIKMVWTLRKNGFAFSKQQYEMLFLGTGLSALFFFYFNAQMHERYSHPTIIFFFFYGVVSKNYRLYILASIPYFLTLDKTFAYPDGFLPIVHYKIIYAAKVIALWHTVVVVYGSYLYYKLVRSGNEEQSGESLLHKENIQ